MDSASKILSKHKIRSTEIRRQVLNVFMDVPDKALSNQDIEEHFDKIDRVTLYRVLKTFEESGLIHQAIDGSNKTKYAYCTDGCTTHHHHDEHAHFYCTQCETTNCLEMVNVPIIKVPKEYLLKDAQLVLSGLCKNCR
jgi:Fur family transcriptional regulator, ferric uptake regulator